MAQSLNFLGLFDENYTNNTPTAEVSEVYVLEQIEARKQAKKDKNWPLSDKIRDDLLANFNVILEDKPDGTVLWRFK